VEELTCELSPLVYAELYRLLSSTQEYEDSLTFRLQELNYSFEWLEEAAATYRARWEYDVQYADVDAVGGFVAQQPDHALLATWILAGLRNTKPCYDLSLELGASVLANTKSAVPGFKAPLPPSLSPVVVGWTLGRLMALLTFLWVPFMIVRAVVGRGRLG
jgi:hypothetical protein